MELVLRIAGKKKTFVAPFISGRMLRRTIEIAKKTDFDNINEETLDTLVDYVVEVYGKQFTRDEFYDGIPVKQLTPTIIACMNEITSGTEERVRVSEAPNV